MNIPISRYWALLSVYLKGQKWQFVALIVALVSSIGLTISIPQVTRLFVDGASSGAELSHLIWLAVAFLAVAIIAQLLNIAVTWLGEVVAWTATNQLRIDLAEHCLGLDMAFHKEKSPGEMIERLDEDVTALAHFFPGWLC